MRARFPSSRILVVDDEPVNVRILDRMLRGIGYEQLLLTTESSAALGLVARESPDVVLLDLMMPQPDGFAILDALREEPGAPPVLVLTADAQQSTLERALTLGARDFLTKPFDRTEAILRIENLIETRLLYRALETEKTTLEDILAHSAQRAQDRAAAIARIEACLAAGALHPVYQPLVELVSRRTVGYEALTRFDAEPHRTPDVWFGEANDVGLGERLEVSAIRAAVGPATAGGTLEGYLSVNLSPETILAGGLSEALSPLEPAQVVLEVTEHAPVADYDALVSALAPFRAAGGRLAVDDAGAGFASLRHILLLNPDIIKLDIALTRDIDTDVAKRSLATALIAFATETGATILAEGIETESELQTLRALGVRYGQGWHLGRPGPLPG